MGRRGESGSLAGGCYVGAELQGGPNPRLKHCGAAGAGRGAHPVEGCRPPPQLPPGLNRDTSQRQGRSGQPSSPVALPFLPMA